MDKFFKLLYTGLFILTAMGSVSLPFAAAAVHPDRQGPGSGKVVIQNGAVSVDLEDALLEDVCRIIEKQGKIYFKGHASLFQKKVTVQFQDLSLPEALKRILGTYNYSIIFDSKGRIMGVRLTGKGQDDPGRALKPQSTSPPPAFSSATGKGKTAPASPKGPSPAPSKGTESPSMSKRAKPSADPDPVSQQNTPSDKPTGSSLGLGGPGKASRAEREKFKVIKSATPPGGPVTVTPEERAQFKTVKNCAPPGGPVTITDEERKQFKVIKNAPPPGS
jgi:hypothetical protein